MRLSLLLIVALSLVWCLIVGEFSLRQWLIGLLFATPLILFTGWGREYRMSLVELPRRFILLVWLALVLQPYHMIQANLQMARRLLRRTPATNPGIIRVPVADLSHLPLGVEAQMITLTPGQLVVDYSEIDSSEIEGSEIGNAARNTLHTPEQGRARTARGDNQIGSQKMLYVHVLDVAAFEEEDVSSLVWMHDLLKRILA